MSDPLTVVNLRDTPQSRPAAPGQVLNSAGGYTFTVDDTARLRRFLSCSVWTAAPTTSTPPT